jgi:hypothetical protein
MIQSGGGLQGVEEESFAKYIRDFHCRYYFELRPIFGARPNIQPWFTNEGQGRDPDEDDLEDNSDDESLFSVHDSNANSQDNTYRDDGTRKKPKVVIDVDADVIEKNIRHQPTSSMKDTTRLNLDVLDDTYDNDSVFGSNNTSKNNSSNISSLSDDLQEVPTTHNKVASTISVSTSTSASRFRRKKVDATKSLSPAIARKMQRSLLTSHQKQINNKKKKAKITGLTDKEEEEKSFLRETRESKMIFEQQVHHHNIRHQEKMDVREERKILMEQERLKMEMEERESKREQAKIQIEMEKTKLTMIKMEMYEKRLQMKRNNPEITDEVLNSLFPM